MRELAVLGKAADAEVDVAAGLVGGAGADERLDHLDHRRDVLSRLRKVAGGQDVQLRLVFEEGVGVEAGDLRGRLALGAGGGDDPVLFLCELALAHVADVGDVLDVVHRVAVGLQKAAQPVRHEIRAQVADVGVAVDGGPAGVKPDVARPKRSELLLLAGQRVIDAHGQPIATLTAPLR